MSAFCRIQGRCRCIAWPGTDSGRDGICGGRQSDTCPPRGRIRWFPPVLRLSGWPRKARHRTWGCQRGWPPFQAWPASVRQNWKSGERNPGPTGAGSWRGRMKALFPAHVSGESVPHSIPLWCQSRKTPRTGRNEASIYGQAHRLLPGRRPM